MLKVFMVIYLHGFIAGYIGPLPYDQYVCEERVEVITQGHAEAMKEQGVELKCELYRAPPLMSV